MQINDWHQAACWVNVKEAAEKEGGEAEWVTTRIWLKSKTSKNTINELEELVKERKVYKIVLGHPKHMNGDVGEKALLCEDFKMKLEELLNVEIILQDERWTTKLATNRLLEFDLSRNKRKKIIDKMAAVVILQNYLDSNRGGK